MKKTVLKYGLLSGSVFVVEMAFMTPLIGKADFNHSLLMGYTWMILSFILVFLGIRSYREHQGGGAITFGKAFQVGLLITLISCVMYVGAWEFVYYRYVPDFADKYAAAMVKKERAKGSSEAKIAEVTKKMDEFRVAYKNPLFNVGMTFMESFPVGLVMALVSAGILRKVRTPVQFSNGTQAAV